MKYTSFALGVVSLSALFFSSAFAANSPYICGSNRITGQLTTSDPAQTTVMITIKQGDQELQQIQAVIDPDGSYIAPIDEDSFVDGIYTIESVATLSGLTDSRTYEAFIGKSCGLCGNGAVEEGEQCESNDDCSEGLFCGNCACLDRRKMSDLIHSYADEVAEYKANEAEQVVPAMFIATGGPFSFVDSLIKKLGVKFASSKSNVYNTVPDRTLDPEVNVSTVPLESVYASLPPVYQNKLAYLRFKGLFVPIEIAGKYATPEQVLEKLNQGATLAPETPSLNTIGAVKMIYTHALSYTASPFAGIGSYISVFGDVGDTFQVYVKKDQRTYEQRTYVVKSKFQVTPEKTEILHNFKKEGADSIAVITCRDGNVLGSTKGREIILAERLKEEMGNFQKTMIAIGDNAQLALAKKKIDAYLAKKDLSDEQVVKLVAKLDEVADKGKGNPLTVITTYGRYMAAYDAVYNDGAL